MPITRSRILLAVLSLTATTALTATLAGPPAGAAAPAPNYTPAPSSSSSAPAQPGPITGLRVAAVTPTSVTLAWNPPAPGCCAIAGYRVTYKKTFDDILRQQEFGNVTTATISGYLFATGEFFFSVEAWDTRGQRSYGGSITVVTPKATSGDVTPPSKPLDLVNLGDTPQGSTLSWTASTDDTGVAGYNIYNFEGLFVSELVATTTGTGTTATGVPSRFPSGVASFYVRARDANGNLSLTSNTVRAPYGSMPPSVPPSVPASVTPSASASPWEPPFCRFQLRVTSRWAGGFVAEWTLTNGSPGVVTPWSVAFRFAGDGRIASGWGGNYTQSGSAVTISNPAWSPSIPGDGTVSGGFVGSGNPAIVPISSAALNGIACALV